MNNFWSDSSAFHQSEMDTRLQLSGEVISDQLMKLLVRLHQEPECYDRSLFDPFELSDIFGYLKSSHYYYLNVLLPKINQSVEIVARNLGGDFLGVKVLSLFLSRYQGDLEHHIRQEETILFGFIQELIHGKYNSAQKDFVINHFLFTHNDNVILKLNELRKDLILLEPELVYQLEFNLLITQLEIFQTDLLIHGLIEDEVLIPKMLDLIDTRFEKLTRLSS